MRFPEKFGPTTIIRDPNRPLMIPRRLIEQQCGLEGVAVYVYLVYRGQAEIHEIAEYFGINDYHVETAVRTLIEKGMLTDEQE